jgi:capsular polysaccharide transport system permease protein
LRPNAGLIPYHVFVHASTGMSHALINNAPLLQLPPVSSFDVIAARGLLEVMTDLVVAVVLLAGFLAIGLRAMPDDLWEPSIALLAVAAFGCGMGFVDAVVTVFWRSWEKAYGQLTRLLYFVSGIFRYYAATATKRRLLARLGFSDPYSIPLPI